MKDKWIQPILFWFALFFEGAIFVLVPASSSYLIAPITTLDPIVRYAMLFGSLGIGGLIGGYLFGYYAAKKGVYRLFVISFLLNIIAFYLGGMVLIFTFYAWVELIVSMLALGFVGAALTIIWPYISYTLFTFSDKWPFLIMLVASGFPFGATLFFLIFAKGTIFSALMIIVFGLILLFFLSDFFITFPKKAWPQKKITGWWPLALNLCAATFMETLLLNWGKLYFERVLQFQQNTVILLQWIVLLSCSLGRVGFAALLWQKNLMEKLLWMTPLLVAILAACALFFKGAINYALICVIGFLALPLVVLPQLVGLKKYPEAGAQYLGKVLGWGVLVYGCGSFFFGQLQAHLLLPLEAFFPLLCAFALISFFTSFSSNVSK